MFDSNDGLEKVDPSSEGRSGRAVAAKAVQVKIEIRSIVVDEADDRLSVETRRSSVEGGSDCRIAIHK